MNLYKRIIGHTKTVMKHRREVRQLCFKCGLYKRGLTHDLSKYSPTEFINGVKFFTGTKSPHHGEREVYGYSKAWLHHKGHNKHHAEYWQDIRPSGKTEPIEIPFEYLIEMICDRVAASMTYLGDKYTDNAPLKYYEEHPEEEKMYYSTKHGMMQVWPQEIYKPILESLISNNPLNTELTYTTYKGKNHYYQIAPSLIKINL